MSQVENGSTNRGLIHPRTNPPQPNAFLETKNAAETKGTEVLILKNLGFVFTSLLQIQRDDSISMNRNMVLKKSALHVSSWLVESKRCWFPSVMKRFWSGWTRPAHRSKGALALGMEWLEREKVGVNAHKSKLYGADLIPVRKDRYTIAWRTEQTRSCKLYVLLTQRACSMREEKRDRNGWPQHQQRMHASTIRSVGQRRKTLIQRNYSHSYSWNVGKEAASGSVHEQGPKC